MRPHDVTASGSSSAAIRRWTIENVCYRAGVWSRCNGYRRPDQRPLGEDHMAAKALPSRTQWDNFDDLYVPEPNTGCYLWLGTLSNQGYGIVHNPADGKQMRASRVAFSRAHGPIPYGLFVLHKCDNPPCVNPDHLFLGTQADNMRDRLEKGRWKGGGPPGEAAPLAKLTSDAVTAIRSSSEGGGVLARRYGVTRWTIMDIRHRRTWHHLP